MGAGAGTTDKRHGEDDTADTIAPPQMPLHVFEPPFPCTDPEHAHSVYMTCLLRLGFAPSVDVTIQDAVRGQGRFAPSVLRPQAQRWQGGLRVASHTTRGLCVRKGESQHVMDACVVYRDLRLRGGESATTLLHVYEVLFLAVHPDAKRRGIASKLVQALRNRLQHECAGAGVSAALCVSIKSLSAEAASFWQHAGLRKLSSTTAAPQLDRTLVTAMIPFDDFTPYGAWVGPSRVSDVNSGSGAYRPSGRRSRIAQALKACRFWS